MLSTITRDFAGSPVTLIERQDGSLWITAEEIGRCLGYSDVTKLHQLVGRHMAEVGSLRSRVRLEVSKDAGAREVVIFEERAVYLLACLARTERAAAFRSWVVETCHDLRTREKVLVSRDEWERHQDLAQNLLSAYERQAEAMREVASAAGHILALRRHSKPKTDPRQLLLDGVTFQEIEAGEEADGAGGDA